MFIFLGRLILQASSGQLVRVREQVGVIFLGWAIVQKRELDQLARVRQQVRVIFLAAR